MINPFSKQDVSQPGIRGTAIGIPGLVCECNRPTNAAAAAPGATSLVLIRNQSRDTRVFAELPRS